jgi:hypothetical protein
LKLILQVFLKPFRAISVKAVNQNSCMKSVENLFTSILKAVGALANNESIFKKRKRTPFNPQLTLGFNFIQGR